MTVVETGEPLSQVSMGDTFRHRKTGGYYDVIAVAEIEATLATVVVYKAHGDGRVWVRPIGEFMDGRFARHPE